MVARVGEQLAFEVANLSAEPLHYVILELGPGPADGVVLPAPGKKATLAPFERRRLADTFAAAPPLGSYRYGLVATASADRWWEGAGQASRDKASVLPSAAALLRDLWQGPRPQASHRWLSGEAWGTASVALELVEGGGKGMGRLAP